MSQVYAAPGCSPPERRHRALLAVLFEVLARILRVRLDGGRVRLRLPVGRAHLAVLLHELERLDQAERLVHRPPNRQIVDRDLAHHAGRIDDEQAAQRDAVRQQHAVVGADPLGQVGEQRILELAEPARLPRRVDPGQVGEVRVDRHADHLRVQLPELVDPIAKGNDFGRTHERTGGWGEGKKSMLIPAGMPHTHTYTLTNRVGRKTAPNICPDSRRA